MFILYAVLVGLLFGFVFGGRMAGLAGIQIRWGWLIVGGLLFQVALFTNPLAEHVGDLGPPLYVGSSLAVAAAVLRNWRITGLPLVLAGACCNFAAIFANGGYMPSTLAALQAAGKEVPTVYNNSTVVANPNLWFLTDIFALPRPIPLSNVFSVGDVLVGAGIMIVIVAAMRRGVTRTVDAGVAPSA
jgi:Family of unknown function (DUF5317)